MYKTEDCPADKTVFAWIAESEGGVSFERRFQPDVRIPGFSYDRNALMEDLSALRTTAPTTPWRSQAPGSVFGMSLHFDPQGPAEEKYCGSFGHPRYRTYTPFDYFKVPLMDMPKAVRGDYLDELAFRSPIPEVANLPELSRIFGWFKRPVVRGTLRVVLGDKTFASLPDGGGMHTDEPPQMAVRINLTVNSSPNFGLQYEGEDPLFTEPGDYKVVCTDFNHRIFVKQPEPIRRIHVVFDVVPWLDYDASTDAWTPNEFWGKKHPYDMIADGDFGPMKGSIDGDI